MPLLQHPQTLPIIISGTGPAALLLAHSLLRSKHHFHIYERDQSIDHRSQGYRFRVTGRGVTSCREILTPSHFALLRDTCGDNLTDGVVCLDPITGETLPNVFSKLKKERAPEPPLTADRTIMRQVLFRGLESHTTFGKEVISFESPPNPEEGVNVLFKDGTSVHGSLLVGADGAFSRIRAQLAPEANLLDTEMQMIFGKTPLTPSLYTAMGSSGPEDPRTKELLSEITLLSDPKPEDSPRFFMYDPMRFNNRNAAISSAPDLASVIPNDYIYWALALRNDRSELCDVNLRTTSPVAFSKTIAKDWDPMFRALLTHQDPEHTLALGTAVATTPPLKDWHEGKKAAMVTLVGDAAHAMPPRGGVGCTTALTDAAVLGDALREHGVCRRALESYEEQMREYGTKAIMGSLMGGKMLLNMRDLGQLKVFE